MDNATIGVGGMDCVNCARYREYLKGNVRRYSIGHVPWELNDRNGHVRF